MNRTSSCHTFFIIEALLIEVDGCKSSFQKLVFNFLIFIQYNKYFQYVK